MAVCNRFTKLENPTGNFLMFSNYTEDICKYKVFDSNYRVVPSKFYVLDADFKKFYVLDNDSNKLYEQDEEFVQFASGRNTTVPKLFQNRFENWVAIGKNGSLQHIPFNETNAFWGFMWSMMMLSAEEANNGPTYFNAIKYVGDISLESYDLHNDMGYAEIICHIPSEATIKKYYSNNFGVTSEDIERKYCEGWSGDEGAKLDSDDLKIYYLKNQDTTKGLELNSEDSEGDSMYSFNMVIICYDVYENGILKYKEKPMGVYFPGIFDKEGNMTNTKNIYVANADAFGASTTYALRICTRFVPNALDKSKDTIITSQEDYTNMGYILSKLADSIDIMNKISNQFATYDREMKETLAQIKNNRTNVPYIIGEDDGTQYWCVNGRKISEISSIANDKEVKEVLDDNFGIVTITPKPKENQMES